MEVPKFVRFIGNSLNDVGGLKEGASSFDFSGAIRASFFMLCFPLSKFAKVFR